MSGKPPIFTIGHSTRSIGEFVELLRRGPVDMVIDVRTVPRSRRNPQYNEDVLGAELAPYQISSRRIADLGMPIMRCRSGSRRRSMSLDS